jgi:hypothetical protein
VPIEVSWNLRLLRYVKLNSDILDIAPKATIAPPPKSSEYALAKADLGGIYSVRDASGGRGLFVIVCAYGPRAGPNGRRCVVHE